MNTDIFAFSLLCHHLWILNKKMRLQQTLCGEAGKASTRKYNAEDIILSMASECSKREQSSSKMQHPKQTGL